MYEPKVYRKQGGNELVVAEGGRITVEDGGEIQLEGLSAEAVALLTLLANLPTSNVASPAIWNDGGVLKVGTA